MRVLLIKTSSMGDVIHTLPALTDAAKIFPDVTFDWVVEENFADIPRFHPRVDKIIPVALRRWRKNIFSRQTRMEFKKFFHALRKEKYDFIIDAQGLLKSVWISCLAKGVRCGFDFHGARESFASFFYQKKYSADWAKHAIVRMRGLFGQVLSYDITDPQPDYGIDRNRFYNDEEKYFVFLHGTTWPTKHWPEEYWIALARLAEQNHFRIKLLWGNENEYHRAERIANSVKNAEILPRLNLIDITKVLANASAFVSVDTGLGHLAAALDVPGVSLYGPTDPLLTGALGRSQIHLKVNFSCAPCFSRECTYRASGENVFPPCFSTLQPDVVWNALASLVKK